MAHLYNIDEIVHGAVLLEEDIRVMDFVLLQSIHRKH